MAYAAAIVHPVRTGNVVRSSGAGYYYRSDNNGVPAQSWNQAVVDGFSFLPGFTVGVVKIEVTPLQPVAQGLFVAHTTDESCFPIAIAEDFQRVTVNEGRPGLSRVYHAVSLDGRRTFQVYRPTGWRVIVRQDAGMWQYRDTADTWQTASENSLLAALREAFAFPENRMTKAELEALGSSEWLSEGGIIIHVTETLDFAQGLQADAAGNCPWIGGYSITYNDRGTTCIEGFTRGGWSSGAGWLDHTISDHVPWARSGIIRYKGAQPFEAEYHVLNEVPGFWFRFRTNGTSAGTQITRILYKAPCQPLRNIGDGQPDIPLGFLFHDVSANLIRDYTVEVSDNTHSAYSKASVPLTPEDYLYLGYLTPFQEIEIVPYEENNTQQAKLSGEYWNGEAFVPLALRDGTAGDTGKTFSRRGKISWDLPADWRTHIPLEAGLPRGYWVRFRVSAALSPGAAISEVRVYGVPEPLAKHRFAVSVKDRIVLLGRPDAPDQADISRALEEYGFTGADSASYRIGGQDAIHCAIAAWNGLFVGKTESWHQLVGYDPSTFRFEGVEAARHIPVNSRVLIKAPITGIEEGSRYGLFYVNRFGAFVVTGLHTDSSWNTARGKLLSEDVNWWDEQACPRLDLSRLHLACGLYWPVKNWVIWAVPMIVEHGQTEQLTNNRLIVYDLSFHAWLPPFTIGVASLAGAYHCHETAPGKIGEMGLYAGDYQGRVLRLFRPQETRDLGRPIQAWAETGWLHLGNPDWVKVLRRVQLYGQASADAGITLRIWTDSSDERLASPHLLTFSKLQGVPVAGFGREEQSLNLTGRFFKFRLDFQGPTRLYGMELDVSLLRQWGAL